MRIRFMLVNSFYWVCWALFFSNSHTFLKIGPRHRHVKTAEMEMREKMKMTVKRAMMVTHLRHTHQLVKVPVYQVFPQKQVNLDHPSQPLIFRRPSPLSLSLRRSRPPPPTLRILEAEPPFRADQKRPLVQHHRVVLVSVALVNGKQTCGFEQQG